MAQSETPVNYYFVRDLKQQVQPPESGMVSHTLHDDDATKIILFGFAPTHELAPHKAAMPATMQFLSGEAEVILGDDKAGRTGNIDPYAAATDPRCAGADSGPDAAYPPQVGAPGLLK